MSYVKTIMLLAICFAMLGGVVLAADETPDRIPFVPGMKHPIPTDEYGYCLKSEPATYKTITKKVEMVKASTYLETVPAEFEEKEISVMVAPEKRIPRLVSPAQYKNVEVKELVQPESEDFVVVPAQWKWVKKTVQIREAHTDVSIAPPTYENITETIEVAPARVCISKSDCAPGEICYVKGKCPAQNITVTKEVLAAPEKKTEVNVPALSKTIRVRQLVQKASTKTVKVPEEYQTYTKQVLVSPAKYEYTTIPAKYKTIKKLEIKTPETTKMVSLPAKFESLSEQVLDKPASMYWAKIPLRKCGKISEVLGKYESFPCVTAEALK